MSPGQPADLDLGLFRQPLGNDLMARVTWSRLAEPGDQAAAALVQTHGAAGALEIVAASAAREHRSYRARLVLLDPRPAVDLLERMGGRLVGPDDDEWPAGLTMLAAPPFCLWVRGPLHLARACRRSVAIVGSRASTPYGEDQAGVLAEGVAERGLTVVSGAAYGIDGRAQAAALAVDGATIRCWRVASTAPTRERTRSCWPRWRRAERSSARCPSGPRRPATGSCSATG